ncbi:hypothetical protein DFH27DRAFT_104218 [Peziza echinospora]|nr:hypothetical protein DFH27DRAFT_104218 [Peziza echinospora]
MSRECAPDTLDNPGNFWCSRPAQRVSLVGKSGVFCSSTRKKKEFRVAGCSAGGLADLQSYSWPGSLLGAESFFSQTGNPTFAWLYPSTCGYDVHTRQVDLTCALSLMHACSFLPIWKRSPDFSNPSYAFQPSLSFFLVGILFFRFFFFFSASFPSPPTIPHGSLQRIHSIQLPGFFCSCFQLRLSSGAGGSSVYVRGFGNCPLYRIRIMNHSVKLPSNGTCSLEKKNTIISKTY